MLELPESYTLSKQVNEYLKGKVISQVQVLHTPHRFAFLHGDVEAYGEMLEGQTILEAKPVGGMLEIDTEDCMSFCGGHPKENV